MADWPIVLMPAVVIALITRVDAKLVGPYFALSAVVAGSEGIDANYWYEDRQRGLALARRFAYPLLAGFLLAFTDWVSAADLIAVGAISASLLAWPVVFHGLPWYVPRRTWHLPALYALFVIGCGLASLSGLALKRLVTSFADGNVSTWLAEQLVGSLILWLFGIIVVLAYRGVFRRTRDEAQRRERAGAESG